ncbi:hypothetical protein PR202_ga19848 [Eleusine coracana subsp. coracana]|uniref:DNA-directed RNA polymerase subunit n=1 Tax=Eleusine coracana subsp. coracana TaxID=191504 RepID=A0AAV5CWW5_ELECO|nr:hypothetical protein PR202_ga19848 [Eleusine coracana subsp. coracana]
MARPEEKLRCTKDPFIEVVGTRRIESIRFSTLSGGEIRKSAEVQVWNSKIYGEDLKPFSNGLLDARMGAPNKLGQCSTCHGSFTECPGHFGYLKLALPVFNVGFFNCILDVLKCICKSCSRVLLVEKDRKEFLKKMRNPRADALQKSAIMKKVRDKCKLSRCPRCEYRNGVVKKGRQGLTVLHDCNKILDGYAEELTTALKHKKDKLSNVSLRMLDPATVLYLFRRMTDEDCELLNLGDRPEKLIVTEIAVPPVPIRPSVVVGGSRSNEDSITVILKSIVNTNSIIKDTLQTGSLVSKCFDCWQQLQLQVVEYINSDAPCLTDSQHRGLVQRLKGKTGRFRGNLSGKRTEYTGRTVISPDPNLRITEVAIPVLMARVLTYPERVSYYNIEKLRQCIRNGPYKHPGANFIIQPDGTKLHLKYCDRRIAARDLKYGCIVERHLEDGDIVLFNRQPSLHRMSIMSHRARIMPWRTLRFNESVCNPYNADFDGDEMNLHVPQTEEARTEALMLMGPIELWTGKQLFSVLVRPNACTKVFLNLTVKEKNYTKLKDEKKEKKEEMENEQKEKKEKVKEWEKFPPGKREWESMCPSDGFVYFRNSELLCGQVGKATLGNGNKNGIYSVLLRDYNSHAAASCMNRLAKFSARFIGNHGFSIGVDDVQPGEHLNEEKKKKIDEAYTKCHDLISLFSKGALTLLAGCNAAQTLEAKITSILNKIRDDTGNAKGFVANSFYTGLTATEFFFHTMGGREGLVDTAVKTAETGYMSRRLMKGLEDLSVFYDQTVRNASGGIVQFAYGDDGMDPAKMEGHDGKPLNLDQLFMKVMATCPQKGHDTLSSKGILQMLKDKLLEHDTSADGGCSEEFKKELETFLKKRIILWENTIKALELDEDHIGKTKGKQKIEGLAANISGISEKQLQVAAAIKIVLKSSQPNLVINLDMQLIEELYMGISADSVQLSILNHPKIKLKSEHVRVVDKSKLRIYPAGTDKRKLQLELHNLKSMLPKVIVKGIPTVERVVINETKKENKKDGTKAEYNLLVEGTNLLAVLGTPGVDARNTKSNHIMEMNKTLGIEAARRSIIDEIQLTMKSHGMNIDARHMMLLADLMTYKGEILGITRYGIAKMKSSVLMLASFEKTSEHLFNASYSGREDQIEGVSECIIMGIPMQLGTGILKVRQRLEQLPEFKYQPDPILSS